MQLAENLRTLRTNARMNQQTIADMLNIERSTYSYYETGRTNPTYETLINIAKIYNISVDDLLGLNRSTPMVADGSHGYEAGVSLTLTAEEKSFIMNLRKLDKESVEKVAELIEKCLKSLD